MAIAKEPELDWYVPIALKMVQAKYSWALGLERRAGASKSRPAPVEPSPGSEAPPKVRRRRAKS